MTWQGPARGPRGRIQATLRSRLISDTDLLNGFIQRSNIPTVTVIYIVLGNISSLAVNCMRCMRCRYRCHEVLCLFIPYFAGSINFKKVYINFCKDLCYGSQNEGVIYDIFNRQDIAISSVLFHTAIWTIGQSFKLLYRLNHLPIVHDSPICNNLYVITCRYIDCHFFVVLTTLTQFQNIKEIEEFVL